MEFENGTRMHIEMLDKPESDTSLIPPCDNSAYSEEQKVSNEVKINLDDDASPRRTNLNTAE